MIRIRALSVAGAAMTFAAACSAPPNERQAVSEQGFTAGEMAAGACTHAICATGAALVSTCDPCATLLCAQDPYCCSSAWDDTCVGEVGSICGQSCTAPPPPVDAGTSTCAHALCATGAALVSACDTCATALCAQDPYCCAVGWDATCVGEVGSICKQSCN